MGILNFLKGSRETDWLPLAVAEEGVTPFGEGNSLTADVLRTVAQDYDPKRYAAPVVTGSSPGQSMAGPAHKVGEYLDPLGHVTALRFDGNVLWGRVREIEGVKGRGRLTDAVMRGRIKRSVGVWRHGIPQTGGTGRPHLRHLAILGGEPEGQAFLPPLTQYIKGALGNTMVERAGGDDGDSVLLRTFNDGAEADPAAGDPPAPEPTSGDNLERSMFAMALSDSEILESINRSVRAGMEGLGASLGTAIDTRLAPIAEQVKSIGAAQELMRTGLDTMRTEVGLREVQQRVDELVRSGHVPPAEAKSEVAGLMRSTAEERNERYSVLGARTPVTATRQTVPGRPAQPNGAPAASQTFQVGMEGDEALGRSAAGVILGEALLHQTGADSMEQLGAVLRSAGPSGVGRPGALLEHLKSTNAVPTWTPGNRQ